MLVRGSPASLFPGCCQPSLNASPCCDQEEGPAPSLSGQMSLTMTLEIITLLGDEPTSQQLGNWLKECVVDPSQTPIYRALVARKLRTFGRPRSTGFRSSFNYQSPASPLRPIGCLTICPSHVTDTGFLDSIAITL